MICKFPVNIFQLYELHASEIPWALEGSLISLSDY